MTDVSSVSSASQGVSDLFQALSSTGSSSVSSVLSSASLQSKLKSASTADVVQLSEQALQLQQASGLFGTPTASATATAASPDSLLLQALTSAITGSTTPPQSTSSGSLSFLG
jgi:hypothetical protein